MKLLLACILLFALAEAKGHRKGKRHHKKPDPEFLKAEEDTWTMWDTSKVNKVPAAKVGESFTTTPAQKLLNLTIHPSTIQLHMDDNLDGFVSHKEFKRWLKDNHSLKKRVEKDWDHADINEDGFITLREYNVSPMGRHARRKAGKKAALAEFKRMDRSKLGKISKKDFFWYVNSDDFGSADVNQDAILTLQEYLTAPFHFHDYDEPSVAQITKEFQESDLNKDGKMTLEEFNTQMKAAREEDRKRDDEDDRDDDNNDGNNDRKRPHKAGGKPKKAVQQLPN
jgi:Ca2+-binding EF-hand superfamily protein